MRKFAPLGILAAAADFGGQCFQPFERGDFEPQFRDGRGGGGLVENFLLGLLNLVLWSFLEVLNVVIIQLRACGNHGAARPRPTLHQFQLTQAASQDARGGGEVTGKLPRATRLDAAAGS